MSTKRRDDGDQPIQSWQDILELAAEAGLVPVGPTLQAGVNFAAAFQPAFQVTTNANGKAQPGETSNS